jgi:hypothetical protein
MVSTGILLIIGAIMATIFAGRLYEFLLQKFRNRDHDEIAEN